MFFLLFTILNTFYFISASPFLDSSRGRIIGGHDAFIGDYPYQVSIQYFSMGHFCGGSIYKPNIIVTAAHCVNGVPEDQIFIRAGSSLRTKGGITVNVKKIIVSNQWNEQTVDSDIALLILSESLPISDEIKTIELATDDVKIGDIAHISGWGLTQNTKEVNEDVLPDKLQAADVMVMDWNECNVKYKGKLTQNMFCAGVKSGGQDACRMDSGGPLVINNKLYGIISWGYECGSPDHPGVYATVKNFVDWINKVLK